LTNSRSARKLSQIKNKSKRAATRECDGAAKILAFTDREDSLMLRTSRFAWPSAALCLAVMLGDTASAQDVLKIGGIGPLSGGGTAWGVAAQRGMELAIEAVNAAGGIPAGGKTYRLELIMYDDQYTGQGGKAAAERLVNQDKVRFIIGPVGSPPALGTISVTNPAKVIALTDGYAPQILRNETHGSVQFPHLQYQHRVRSAADQVAQGQHAGDQEGRAAGTQRCGRPIGRRTIERGLQEAGF
jgi:hypothetical protein